MNLIILLPVFLTLAFAVVLSNQLLQAAGVKSSIKFWTDVKSKFLIFYEHNDLFKNYITKPLTALFGKSDSSSGSSGSGLTGGKLSPYHTKLNVAEVAYMHTYNNINNPSPHLAATYQFVPLTPPEESN